MKKTLLELVGSESSPARNLVSKVWRRYAMPGARDDPQALDRLYALPDPWGMTTGREQSRFAQTNAIIREHVGHSRTILEVGSGEGHQSEHLATLCDELHGIDVSARAVERARQRLPQARFGVGSLAALPWGLPEGGKYDLVVACEVLYYMGDIDAAVVSMSKLGRCCLVTFFCPSAKRVAQHVESIPGAKRGWIYHDPYAWLWAFWQCS